MIESLEPSINIHLVLFFYFFFVFISHISSIDHSNRSLCLKICGWFIKVTTTQQVSEIKCSVYGVPVLRLSKNINNLLLINTGHLVCLSRPLSQPDVRLLFTFDVSWDGGHDECFMYTAHGIVALGVAYVSFLDCYTLLCLKYCHQITGLQEWQRLHFIQMLWIHNTYIALSAWTLSHANANLSADVSEVCAGDCGVEEGDENKKRNLKKKSNE